MNIRPKTIFCDIDGCLIPHKGKIENQPFVSEILEGTLEKLSEWDKKGYNLILTTGRRESTREQTEKQLLELGIFYDQLIMGIGGGDRIIINDTKPNSEISTAMAFSPKRNIGIKDLDI
jgi:FMN phosphatase YigB (HAD superfamily)